MPNKIEVHFIKPGLRTTIQDYGRKGCQHLGIPVSGALDKEAMAYANQLVGNSKNTPVLECTMVGPEIKFHGESIISLTGAEMNATLNGNRIERYSIIKIKAGDILSLKAASEGCRAYIGIQGIWKVTSWMGSHSALSNFMSNGFLGAIRAKDTLEIESLDSDIETEEVKLKKPYYSSCYIVRVVTGPDFERFNINQIENFFHQIFTVSQDANRMGYRLNESLLNYNAEKVEISSGIIPGTIQITNSGQPIVLLADAQTTGGYPRIANVVSEDLDMFGQIKAGDEVKFMLATL